ncbi:glutamine synthetase family protein [Granulosicoccus antarcticus]|uniref:Glutamate--isopropylamine ligase n=1 Tax=Granulosicoccus antarcticus IMCC3135 TaxID=1192854 RepID=A0A2Z2P3J7_9GAMM|nr:glutamine synthetase family protein [Granulosicoccus antarcticus]ASJ76010.1 Glutamate--isopropylamine ligase [Granulosicoccus antarcticus IMCC3135]
MPGNLTLDALKSAADDGTIDTVVVAMVDMQGRLLGKRFHVSNFLETAYKETHCCNYLLATDFEMATPDGYASTSWSAGYGDYIMKPDMSTLRRTPWAEGAAMVLCDVLDHKTHAEVPHSPRAMLKRQIERLKALGLNCIAATELEFFVYRETYEQAREKQYRDLTPISAYNEDYHILQTAREEGFMRPLRNQLYAAGVPVEGTKGEAEAGQAELNLRYSDALDMADTHSLAKHATKEIAWNTGCSVSFVAKPHEDLVGSSSHIHQSLRSDEGKPAFFDADAPHGMSTLMRQYLAGLLTYASDSTVFLAPYINSYKRFAKGTFAPTRIIWSIDNRTAGFRIVAPDSDNVRIECRIGGSDMNPYLALASQIAAGIAGIEQSLSLPPVYNGDAYGDTQTTEIPNNLRDATAALDGSSMLRSALGDEVVDHYVRAARWEQEEFDRIVTEYEIRRGFERS